jgi:two-component system, cell cycle sensor histidine kinase and response regulator CckA
MEGFSKNSEWRRVGRQSLTENQTNTIRRGFPRTSGFFRPPVSDLVDVNVDLPSIKNSTRSSMVDFSSLKILFVEDNPGDYLLTNESLMSSSLLGGDAGSKLQIIWTKKLSEALNALKENPFDVVLLDMRLPDADGVTGIKKIQQISPKTPIILLTGLDDINIAKDALSAGAQDYLVKGQTDGDSIARSIFYAHERRKKELEREKLELKLWQSQKLESMGMMAQGIAHDFNNLLMGVLANVSLALKETSQTEPILEKLIRIEGAGRCATELVKQLFNYAGQGELIKREIVLGKIVEEIGDLLKAVVSKKATLQYSLCPDLPNIYGDPTQIRQVVMNLISNATEAFNSNGGTIKVSTGVVRIDAEYLGKAFVTDPPAEGVYSYLEVTDDGCGMDDYTKARIFDPFFTTKFTGRGLGLAAVLGIVRSHRGSIIINSTPGQGSSFKVLFPAHISEVVEVSEKEIKETNYQPTKADELGKCLLIDDEKMVREVAKEMLESIGFDVQCAEDGFSGVDLLKNTSEEINCVFLDLNMPKVSGRETLEMIRRIYPKVPIVVTSGFDEKKTREEININDNCLFLQKPYGLKELIKCVSKIL